MFNPEKLLGGLIRSSTRGSRGGLGGLVSGGAALGVLGVAMEAVEHFMNQSQGPGPTPNTWDTAAHARFCTAIPTGYGKGFGCSATAAHAGQTGVCASSAGGRRTGRQPGGGDFDSGHDCRGQCRRRHRSGGAEQYPETSAGR